MFHVKLVARPDARMVEVPLEVEAELPREFDGAALLASSGLPRKVKIKAQRDTLKLSTAYRADQLLGDVVRTTLKGTPQDVTRVTEATAVFVRKVRERRPDGASLLVQSNGRGKIEVIESFPQPQGRGQAPAAQVQASGPGGTLADRMNALERRLADLEAKLEAGSPTLLLEQKARAIADGVELKVGARLDRLEERLATGLVALAHKADAPPPVVSLSQQAAVLPSPGSGRANLRRSTAVEAFADGLRAELKSRAEGLAAAAEKTSTALDRAEILAADAERTLGAASGAAEALRLKAQEAGARARGLRRVAEEVDLYAPGELSVAGALLDRLGDVPDQGAALGLLRAQAEALLVRSAAPEVSAWLERAAPVCGWTLIAPAPGEAVDPALHEADGSAPAVTALLSVGARGPGGEMLRRARVRAASVQPLDEDAVIDGEPVVEGEELTAVADADGLQEAEVLAEHEPEPEPVRPPLVVAPVLPPILAPIATPSPAAPPIVAAPATVAAETAAAAAPAPPAADDEPVEADPIEGDPVAADEAEGFGAAKPEAAAARAAEVPAADEPEAVATAAATAVGAAAMVRERDAAPAGDLPAGVQAPRAEGTAPPRPFDGALLPDLGEEGVRRAVPLERSAPPAESQPRAPEQSAEALPRPEAAPAPQSLLEARPDQLLLAEGTPIPAELAPLPVPAPAIEPEQPGDADRSRLASGPSAFHAAPQPPAPTPAAPEPAPAALELGDADVEAVEFDGADADAENSAGVERPSAQPPAPPPDDDPAAEPVAAETPSHDGPPPGAASA